MTLIEKIIIELGWTIRKYGEIIHDYGLKIHLNRKYGK
jgi:hypothetical protein